MGSLELPLNRVAGLGRVTCQARLMITCVASDLVDRRVDTKLVGTLVTRSGVWNGGVGGGLARPPTRPTVIFLPSAATELLDLAPLPALAAAESQREHRLRALHCLRTGASWVMARSTTTCDRLIGCTCPRRAFLAAPSTPSRVRTCRPASSPPRRRTMAPTGMSTVQLRLGSGGAAGMLATTQFVGGELRLGRAMPTLLARERPREFEGNLRCLGRRRPVASRLPSVVCGIARPTSPYRSTITPSAWPPRGSAREDVRRAPLRPSAWRPCAGGSRPVLALLASTTRKPTRWARNGLNINPPLRQARPPKRVATARRRLRWGQKKS